MIMNLDGGYYGYLLFSWLSNFESICGSMFSVTFFVDFQSQ